MLHSRYIFIIYFIYRIQFSKNKRRNKLSMSHQHNVNFTPNINKIFRIQYIILNISFDNFVLYSHNRAIMILKKYLQIWPINYIATANVVISCRTLDHRKIMGGLTQSAPNLSNTT